MKRVLIVLALAVLSGLYLYSAFAPAAARRRLPLFSTIGVLRRVLHGVLGIVLFLIVLLVMYGAFVSTFGED